MFGIFYCLCVLLNWQIHITGKNGDSFSEGAFGEIIEACRPLLLTFIR